MQLLEQIRAAIAPSAEGLGYRLVQIRFNETAKRRTLQIMAERFSDQHMTIEDCEKLSRTVSAVLDVEDIVKSQYNLEVSSPGIDRPLTALNDYTRFLGHEVKLELGLPVEGRKRFTGILEAVDGENVAITVDGRLWQLPFGEIVNAKLVLTEKLIKAEQARMKAVEDQRKQTETI
jgi:ribosome maturation factor RimP